MADEPIGPRLIVVRDVDTSQIPFLGQLSMTHVNDDGEQFTDRLRVDLEPLDPPLILRLRFQLPVQMLWTGPTLGSCDEGYIMTMTMVMFST